MPLSLEQLEARVLLTVGVRQSGGLLTVQGDAAHDNVRFEGTGVQGQLDLFADQDGNGSREFVGRYTGVQSIQYLDQAGDDRVTFQDVDLLGGLRVVTGAGDDSVDIQGSRIGGRVVAVLGAGDDELQLGGNSRLLKDLSVNGGDGHDQLKVESQVFIASDLAFQGGNGNDSASVRDRITVLGSVRLILGNGNNQARLADTVNVTGSVIAVSGVGADELELRNGVSIGLNLNLRAGDGDNQITLRENIDVGGATLLQTGAGNDDVLLEHLGGSGHVQFGQSLAISTGAGNDTVTFRGAVLVDGLTTINTGAGNDDVDVGDASQSTTTLLNGGLLVDLSSGNDEFAIVRTNVTGKARVIGGSGLDEGVNGGLNSFSLPLLSLTFDAGNLH